MVGNSTWDSISMDYSGFSLSNFLKNDISVLTDKSALMPSVIIRTSYFGGYITS